MRFYARTITRLVFGAIFFSLEQVYVRGFNRRILRLEAIAGLGLVLAVLPAAAEQMGSQTALNVETRDLNGRTQATASIAVTGEDGLPASGVVSIEDGALQLAQVALDGQGRATAVVTLTPGDHALRAVYSGDASHRRSISFTSDATGTSSATPSFTITLAAVAPSTLPLDLTAGDAGTIAVTVTPVDNSALSAPMFVTLSCSGLPSLSSCTFTPESIEILPTTPTSCAAGSLPADCPPVSSMLIQTEHKGTAQVLPPARPDSGPGNHVAWAVVLPGMLGLGGLAWGARKRRWLQRLALVALVGLVATLGTTACNPRYYYEHHGPPTTPATPSGTFNITVTGQSSNGVTSITSATTMVLTVK